MSSTSEYKGPKYDRVGEIRPSQLLFTYGIGALADLPGMSVIILGLDSWDKQKCMKVDEPRLLQSVRSELPHVKELRLPPIADDELGPAGQDMSFRIGVPVMTFPRWVRCSACSRLLKVDSTEVKLQGNSFRPDLSFHYHDNCQKKGRKPKVLPVRFMVACQKGHLADFPWVDFVHRGSSCGSPQLEMYDDSASGDATQITVRCTSCNSIRKMVEAIGERGKQALPQCPGRHPQLHGAEREECSEQLRSIAIGSSNLWFPRVISALSIPDAEAGVKELVKQKWSDFEDIEDLPTLEFQIKQMAKKDILGDLAGVPAAEILAAIKQAQNTDDVEESDPFDVKEPEYRVLASGKEQNSKDFRIRYVSAPVGFESFIDRVGLVERLREVRALTGFFRIEAPGDGVSIGEHQAQNRAPISIGKTEWVPVSEVRGEGLFIQFNEDFMTAACESASFKVREDMLRTAHEQWRRKRGMARPEAGFPGIRFVFLHSFAHAIIRQLSLDRGYSSASIRERIYSDNGDDGEGAMAGLLLYTAASDSEGTLGGLVSMGVPEMLGIQIQQALEELSTCAADPYCAEHDSTEDVSLHAAACHACSFIPETSCERGNRYLDREVLQYALLHSPKG